MPDVRYVCLSDLHFGAQNSLLTHIPEGSVIADPMTASPTLIAFVDCLEALIGTNEDPTTKPELVLNGDILEFALATDDVALLAFQRFVELALVERNLFGPTIHYIPGNHDHHLWETARERQYANYVARCDVGVKMNPPWHGTPMFGAENLKDRAKRRIDADLLDSVIRRFDPLRESSVEVHYPNFGLRSEHGRAVIFHHGHFIESIYRLMSELRTILFPASISEQGPWDIEQENFAWIDFLWSTLGRSGQMGADVGLLYDMLQDRRALQAVADNVVDAIVATGKPAPVPKFARAWGARKILDTVLARVTALERNNPAGDPTATPLSAAGISGLQHYLEFPLLKQLEEENPGPVPGNVIFVFGHTHKPYEGSMYCPRLGGPVDVYNSGGWVVDTLENDTRAGAAAVLIDEDLHAASLRMYNQPPAPGGSCQVAVHPVEDPTGNPLAERLRSKIDPQADPWATFSTEVAKAIPQRHACLRTIIDRSVVAAKARPAAK